MTVSLEEQLRSLAAASLEPPSDGEPTDAARPRRSTRSVWVACAAAMVAVVLLGGVLVSRVERSGTAVSVPPAVDLDEVDPHLYGGWPQPSLEVLAGSSSMALLTDLVVVGVIGGTGSSVATPAPGGAPGTHSYTPVSLAVETVIRNRSERDVPDQLTIRDWIAAADAGPHLSVLPEGTRVVAFVQEPADALDDGADTVAAVFLVDDVGRVHDPATGGTLQLVEVMLMFGPKGPRDLIGLDAPTLRGTAIDGTPVDLDSYRGRWVVLHLFAAWCEPCRRDLPRLTEVAGARPDVQFLTLLFDDAPAAAGPTLADAGVDWPVLDTAGSDGRQVLVGYRVSGLPEVIVIGPDGTIVDVHSGVSDASALLDAID